MVKPEQAEKYCQELFSRLKANQGKSSQRLSRNYGGSDDPSLYVSNSVMRQIAKEFVKDHPNLTFPELLGILNLLNRGKTSTEKRLGGMLLQYDPRLRARVEPNQLDAWLNNLKGWAQVDSLCQSVFTATDLLAGWKKWEKTIIKLSQVENVNKRRASLVLLTAPVRQSSDQKLRDLAFLIVDRLAGERNILITKAISWLLREMIKHHRSRVVAHLEKNELLLPKVAVRETNRKLESGRK